MNLVFWGGVNEPLPQAAWESTLDFVLLSVHRLARQPKQHSKATFFFSYKQKIWHALNSKTFMYYALLSTKETDKEIQTTSRPHLTLCPKRKAKNQTVGCKAKCICECVCMCVCVCACSCMFVYMILNIFVTFHQDL